MPFQNLTGLTIEGCQDRQHILREYLRSLKLDAALILDRRHIHYLTGYWVRSVFAPALLVECEGPTTLAAPTPPVRPAAADDVRTVESTVFCTLVDDQQGASLEVLKDRVGTGMKVGSDAAIRPGKLAMDSTVDLTPTLFAMRRCKDEDELAFLKEIIAATEETYRYAKETLRPGISEVELWAGMQRVAAECLGEFQGEFGNDFQIGSIGSPPRRQAAEVGQTAILDLSLSVRGYCSDMCRTFVVGGEPSEAQTTAHARILSVFPVLERKARPGASCRELDATAREMLKGEEGWEFFHHLGHGVGMNGHETPRLNPLSNDRLQVGDIFTLEPGLYGPGLNAGIRIEQMYHVGEKGVERLTSFPEGL